MKTCQLIQPHNKRSFTRYSSKLRTNWRGYFNQRTKYEGYTHSFYRNLFIFDLFENEALSAILEQDPTMLFPSYVIIDPVLAQESLFQPEVSVSGVTPDEPADTQAIIGTLNGHLQVGTSWGPMSAETHQDEEGNVVVDMTMQAWAPVENATITGVVQLEGFPNDNGDSYGSMEDDGEGTSGDVNNAS